MIATVNILILLVLSWFYFGKRGHDFPRLFWMALIWRIALGLAVGLVYRYYYTNSDTWLFFSDANQLMQFGKQDFIGYLKFMVMDEVPESLYAQLSNSQERSLFLIKIMSVFSWLGGENYWVSALWFAFLSFLCAWQLFMTISSLFEKSWLAAALSFLFFPSVSFWGSGLIKETLALSGLFVISSVCLRLFFHHKVRWHEYILAAIGFWVAWRLKYYWTALFVATVFTHFIIHAFRSRFHFLQRHSLLSWMLVFAVLCGGVSLLHPNFYPHRFLEVVVTNHDEFVRISDSRVLIHYHQLEPTWKSIMLNAPWALFSGLFRPFIWEAAGVTMIAASLENMIITVLLITALFKVGQIGPQRLLVLSVLAYIVLLCIFLALSTPNLGTLSRYRVGFMPFLIFLISYRNPLLNYLQHRFRHFQ